MSRSGLRSDCGSFHKLPGPPRGPGFGMTRVSLACARPPQGGPIGCSPPHAPLEGSFHVRPWGSLDTPPRGLSHATPLGACCVTVHDPSPAHAGGSFHPCQGVSPTYPPPEGPRLAGPGAVSRHPLSRSGGNPVLRLSDSVPLGARCWAPYGGGQTGSPSRGTLRSVPQGSHRQR